MDTKCDFFYASGEDSVGYNPRYQLTRWWFVYEDILYDMIIGSKKVKWQ